MVAFWLFILVIFLILSLLLLPVSVGIHHKTNTKFYVRYLFFNIKCNDLSEDNLNNVLQNKNNTCAQTESKISKQKNKKIKDILKKYKTKQLIAIFRYTCKQIKGPVSCILKHIKIKKLHFYTGISGKDSADCANKTAFVSCICYPLFVWISNKRVLPEKYKFKIEPLFLAEESKIYLDLKIQIPLIVILLCVIKSIFKFIKIYRKL